MKEDLYCYRRVSTTKQRKEGTSLEQQKVIGQKVSKKLNMNFVDVNEGSRSSTRDYRDKLEELKDDIKRGKVKNVWCLERSRMFRDTHESMDFRVRYLDEYSVNLLEGKDGRVVQVETSEESFIYDTMTRFHQMMNDTNTERFYRGKKYKLKRDKDKGVFLGQTILFGYENIKKRWKVHKEDSKIVKMIFDMYEKGSTIKDIKNKLDREGIKTRRTRTGLWNLETLRRMLTNRSYIGIHRVVLKGERERKLRRRLRKGGKSLSEINKRCEKFIEEREVYNIKVPNLISVSQFNRVNKLIEKNQKNKDNNKKYETLLSDFLRCECSNIYGSRIKNYTNKKGFKENSKFYYCVSKNYSWKEGTKSECVNKRNLDMTRTDEEIISIIKNVVSDSSVLKEKMKTKVLGRKNTKDKEIEKERQVIEKKIQRIQKEIENIEEQVVELVVSSGISKREQSLTNKINERYSQELDLRFEHIKECEDRLEDLDQDQSWVDWIGQHGKELDLQTKDSKSQKEFLDKTIDEIIVHSVFGKNRDNEVKQIGHSFDIKFKLKLVNDSIKYIEENKKSKGYDVIEGRSSLVTDTLDVSTKVGRKRLKKKEVESV